MTFLLWGASANHSSPERMINDGTTNVLSFSTESEYSKLNQTKLNVLDKAFSPKSIKITLQKSDVLFSPFPRFSPQQSASREQNILLEC